MARTAVVVGTATATATVPSPPPTPAPAARVRSYGWVWPVAIVIIGLVFLVWVLPTMRTTAPAPQATAPKRELRQHVEKRGLSLVGDDRIFNKEGFVEIRKGGRAFFVTNNLPWRKDAVFHVAVRLRQKTTGNIVLLINGGRGGEKSYLVPRSSEFGNAVFFDSGEIGRSDYFNPGTNQIIVSSPNSDTTIQCVSIEMLWQE